MDNLTNQLNFDCMAVQYLAIIEAKATSSNLQIIREQFKNNQDDLLDGILNIDEVRKSRNRVIIENFKKAKRRKNVTRF
jgi:hypothetical protein